MSLVSNVITFKPGVKPEGAVVADIENGYCKIANELLDSFCQLDISGTQFQLLLSIVRATYGYNKKADRVTNTYLAELTGISLSAVKDGLIKLAERNIIVVEKSGIMKLVSVNKTVSDWVFSSGKKLANTRTKATNAATQESHERGHKKLETRLEEATNAATKSHERGHTKDNLNTTYKIQPTKDNQSFSDQIKLVFEHWKTAMAKPLAKLTEDRKSKIKARLEDGYSVETIIRAIDGCAASDFHMGRQAGSAVQYCDFDLICRNGSKLEQFAAMPLRTEPVDWSANIMQDAEILF